jgi:hypothetical protein
MSPLPPGSRTRQKGRLKSGDWSGDAETTPAHGRRISQAELYNRSAFKQATTLLRVAQGITKTSQNVYFRKYIFSIYMIFSKKK